MSDKRLLIIAQTPPPYHGQAIMQKYLVDVNWNWCKKEFVRMGFSEEIKEVGVFKIRKLRELFGLIGRVNKKSRPKLDLIYYPPGGPNRIPVYRDIIILFFLKIFSRKLILHFHAGGINQIFNKVTKLESFFIKKAFNKVDAIVVLTEWLKKEVEWCKPKKIYVVGNGIEDVFDKYQPKRNRKKISFLFVGNLKKEKGIFTLLDAAALLKDRNEEFEITFIGSFHTEEEKNIFQDFINKNSLTEYIKYLGPKNGDEKWEKFAEADVFCLPTYETEAMPISILEAMMFQMPVITTNWRSIPDIIRHDGNGLLFQPGSADQLADCMQRMLNAENERIQIGIQARKDYLQNYTVGQHLNKMENVFREILTP